MLANSQNTLHSANSCCGCVSWKYCPPISSVGMCAAMASTGTPLRLASYRPLIRCRAGPAAADTHTASDLQRADAETLARDAEARGWGSEADRHRRLIERLDTHIRAAQAG